MRGEPNIVQLVGFVILTSALGVSTAHGQTLSETPIATQNYSTTAAGTNRPLQLAADSPFRDPNIIYLEADFEEGGILGASFVVRDGKEGVELYNAYYTACEPCQDTNKNPTWQIKARKVKQNPERNSIEYRDAVFQLVGLPVFYTPFLSHPDPSAKRASGLLAPFGGIDRDKGLNIEAPYYWAIDDYTEATITPHLYAKVNPLLEVDFRRKFYTGEVNINTSMTYGSAFDNDGDPFDDPLLFANQDEATTGKRLRSHVFADGLFNLTNFWTTGFGVQAATDDLYLRRYDLDERPAATGLYQSDSLRLLSQALCLVI